MYRLLVLLLTKKKSNSTEIFQRINTDPWQKVFQYKGKKVICKAGMIIFYTDPISTLG